MAADSTALHDALLPTQGTGMDGWHPPHIAHLLPRQRLLDAISTAQAPCLLLAGPPGSGKSCLLAALYQQQRAAGLAVAWLQLHEEHNAPDALAQALTQLCVSNAALLLVDDLHLLHSPARQQFSRWWLGQAGRRIIAADRRLHGTALYQAQLHGQLQVLDASQLQLDDAEAGLLLGTAFSSPQASLLNRRLAGWAAGLRLLALHPEQAGYLLGPADLSWQLPPAIAAWLAEVVLPGLHGMDPTALGILAAIGEMPAALLNQLPEPQRLLQTVEQLGQAGLLLCPPPAQAGWVLLHPVIASHQREQLRLQQPQLHAESKRLAAHWFAQHDQPAQAVRHALELPQKEEAAALIERAGAITLDLGNAPDLPLAPPLPPERAYDRPLLFLSQVYQRLRHGHPGQAGELFQQGSALTSHYTRLAADADLVATRTWVTLLEGVFHTCADNPIPDALLQDMQQHFVRQREQQPTLAACVASVLAYHHMDMQQHAQAMAISQAGLQLLQHQPEKISVFLLLHLGYAQLALHGPQLATATVERARAIADSTVAADSYEVLSCQLLQGVLLAEDNQAEAALALLLPALEKIDQVYGWVCLYAQSHAAAADALYRCQGLEAALALLARGHAFAEQRQLPRLHHHLALSQLQLLNRAGQWRQAQALLQGPLLAPLLQPDADQQPHLRGLQGPLLLEAAHLQLLLGQVQPAQALLEQIPAPALANLDCRHALFQQVLQMRIAQSLRRLGQARQCLQQALQLSADNALRRRSRDAADWLQQAAQWAVNDRWPLPERLVTHLQQLGGIAQPWVLPRQAGPAHMPHTNTALSPRECQTMALLAEGLSSKEIARQLGISAGTVKTHRKKIYEKLAVSNRAQAIIRARSLLIL
ncbi:LuxR C-terminal-related transcriptional regulator [Stenotrophomonas ginsengisoli]|nr:LuxR C-terminal-related transcriptional regulator [Stenotrophomonas ginsengisoli]